MFYELWKRLYRKIKLKTFTNITLGEKEMDFSLLISIKHTLAVFIHEPWLKKEIKRQNPEISQLELLVIG